MSVAVVKQDSEMPHTATSLAYSSNLKETAGASETSVPAYTAHIPEDCNLNVHRRDGLTCEC